MPVDIMLAGQILQAASDGSACIFVQGLGKTVELLACVVANRFKGPRLPAELVGLRLQHVACAESVTLCPFLSVQAEHLQEPKAMSVFCPCVEHEGVIGAG